eukprot:962667_1
MKLLILNFQNNTRRSEASQQNHLGENKNLKGWGFRWSSDIDGAGILQLILRDGVKYSNHDNWLSGLLSFSYLNNKHKLADHAIGFIVIGFHIFYIDCQLHQGVGYTLVHNSLRELSLYRARDVSFSVFSGRMYCTPFHDTIQHLYVFPMSEHLTFANYSLRHALVPYTTYTKSRHNLDTFKRFASVHYPLIPQSDFFEQSSNVALYIKLILGKLAECEVFNFGWIGLMRKWLNALPCVVIWIEANMDIDAFQLDRDPLIIIYFQNYYIASNPSPGCDQHAYDRIHKHHVFRQLLYSLLETKTHSFVIACESAWDAIKDIQTIHMNVSRNLLLLNPRHCKIASWYDIDYVTLPGSPCDRLYSELCMMWPAGSAYDPRFQTTKDIVSHITIGSKQLNNSLQGILFWNAMKRKDVSKIVIGCDTYIEESTRSHFHGLTKYFPWMDAVSDDGVFAGIDERPLVVMNSDWNDDEVEVKSSQEVTGNRTFLDSQESDGDLTQSNSHQSPTIEAARITNVSRNSRSNGSRSYPRRCDIIQRNDIVTRSVAHQNMILSTIPLIDNMIQSEKWTEMNTLYKKLLSAMSNQRIEFIADIILNPIIHELNSIIKESTQKLVLHPIVLSGSSITANSFIAYNNAFNISDKMNTLINHCIGLTIAIMAKSMKHHAKGSADRITTRSELTKLKLQPKVMKQINRMCYFARMCAKYHKVFWINVSCISYQQSPSIQALVHLLDTDYDIIKGTMLIMQRNNNHNMQMQLKDPWTIEYIKKFFVFCS